MWWLECHCLCLHLCLSCCHHPRFQLLLLSLAFCFLRASSWHLRMSHAFVWVGFSFCVLCLLVCTLPVFLQIKFLKKEDSVWACCVSCPCVSWAFSQDPTKAVTSWLVSCRWGWCLALGQLSTAWGMCPVLSMSHKLLISWLLKTCEVHDNIELTWALCCRENSHDYAIPPPFGVLGTGRPQKTTLLSHILT